MLDHLGMAAKIAHRVGPVETPDVSVLADQVIHAADFAGPFLVVPGSADGWDVRQPGYFASELPQFVEVAELP